MYTKIGNFDIDCTNLNINYVKISNVKYIHNFYN